MTTTEKLAALDAFIEEIERLHIESLKAGTWDEIASADRKIADKARCFCGMLKPARTEKLRAIQ